MKKLSLVLAALLLFPTFAFCQKGKPKTSKPRMSEAKRKTRQTKKEITRRSRALASSRPLRALPTALDSKISAQTRAQSFAEFEQQRRALALTRPRHQKPSSDKYQTASVGLRETSQLTDSELTLLSTYKFLEEKGTWPRTTIYRDGRIILSTEYTVEEQLEVSLGMSIMHRLRSQDTPPEIRQELLELQHDFSDKYTSQRIIENLNEWIDIHQSWPKEYETPITEAEIYETALAQAANQITETGFLNSKNPLPDELIEQIRQVRSFYDLSYLEQPRELINELYDWIERHNGAWPRMDIIDKEPGQALTPEERSEIRLARRVYSMADRTFYPKSWPQDLIDQMLPIREHYNTNSFITLNSVRETARFSPTQTNALLDDLESYILTNKRWPKRDSAIEQEAALGKQIETFVLRSHPYQPDVWLKEPAFTNTNTVLRTGTPYLKNPNLERARKLYYYAKYLENYTERELPKDHYIHFEKWYYELKELFPSNPYRHIQLPE